MTSPGSLGAQGSQQASLGLQAPRNCAPTLVPLLNVTEVLLLTRWYLTVPRVRVMHADLLSSLTPYLHFLESAV
jgi:hypothetical protein